MLFDAGAREIARQLGGVALDQSEIGQLRRHDRMKRDLRRPHPAHAAPRLRPWRAVQTVAAKHVHDDMEAGPDADVVDRDRPQRLDRVARLFGELAARGVLDALVRLDQASRQEPRVGEGSGRLVDDENALIAIDARDDRADARGARLAQVRRGAGVGVSRGVLNGNGVGVGGRVPNGNWNGVGVGVGVGDGVGHGSGPTRFQVYRP